MLFCNIGWMKHYEGITASDAIARGGSYVDKHGMGHEVFNFLPHRGWLYGYVQAKGQIHITKLGAAPDDDFVDGVTVVWTATRPKGGTVVVGWYRNARVYRHYQETPSPGAARSSRGVKHHNIRCRAGDATLLPEDQRNLDLPTGSGGRGQSPLWYADSEPGLAFQEHVRRLIKEGRPTPQPRRRGAPDVERNKLVEMAGMEVVTAHYRELGYTVKWVHNENKGWDIEATSGRTKLNIEVKGLSQGAQQIELTPNEYRAFLETDVRYRLAIVTNALSKAPRLSIMSFNGRSQRWEVEGKPKAKVSTKEVIAARITIV
jgi:hypothetical protein